MAHGPFTLEELNKIPQFYSVKLNHAKDMLSFYWDKTGRLELYTLDLRRSEIRQISHGEVPRVIFSGQLWTRDDRALIFAKDQQGNEKHDLYRIELEDGRVTQLTSTPEAEEHAVDTSPDGRWLLFLTTRAGQMNLWRLDLQNPGLQEPLTQFEHPVLQLHARFSADGERLYFLYNDTDNLQNMDVWSAGADGSHPGLLYQHDVGCRVWFSDDTADGKTLAICSDASGTYRVGLLDRASGLARWLGDGSGDEYPGRFTKDGRLLACIRNRDAVVAPMLYDTHTGAERTLTGMPLGIAAGTSLALDDTSLILALNTPTRPSVLVKYDLENDSSEELITPDYGSVDPDQFVEDEYVRFRSSDGTEIAAVLYKPAEIPEGATLPALVEVHGGPRAQNFRAFNRLGQIWASKGYVVLLPNFRGSTGYGRQFVEANLKDLGGGDLEDVSAGREYLSALPFVDETRIGLYGISYGGYMTFMQVAKRPGDWAAGCAWIGFSDLHSLYEASEPHFKYSMRRQMGDPEADAELWRERSPLNYVANVKAPLLIIHGVNDPRCPIGQSRAFRDGLIRSGKQEGTDFEYVEFDDEGHGGWTDQEMRTRTFALMIDFFDRRLKGFGGR